MIIIIIIQYIKVLKAFLVKLRILAFSKRPSQFSYTYLQAGKCEDENLLRLHSVPWVHWIRNLRENLVHLS